MEISDVVVSLWQGPVIKGDYLGCGVCVSEDWILTAKHVIQGHAKDQLKVGLIPSRDSGLSVTDIQFHEERDIALVKCTRRHKKPSAKIDFSAPLIDGAQVELLSYNVSEKCVKGPFSVQLINWTEPGGWEFHTQPSPGMSGGGALLGKKLIGVIQARDESENSGIIIPVKALRSFLEDRLGEHLQGGEVSEAGKYRELPKEDGSFRKRFVSIIIKLFDNPEAKWLLKALADDLQINLEDPTAKSAIVEELLHLDADQAIRDYLQVATEECLSPTGRYNNECEVSRGKVKEIAEEILGWLVLSSVDENQVAEMLPDGLGGNEFYFVLAHRTPGGAEIAISRRFQRTSTWQPADTVGQRSPYLIEVDSAYFGEDDDDIVRTLMVDIWNRVLNDPMKRKKAHEALSAQEIRDLNARLRHKRKLRKKPEHYYIAFSSDDVEPTRVRNIYKKLLSPDRLGQMTVVELGVENGSHVLLLDEEYVIEAINGFYYALHQADVLEQKKNT